MPLVPSDPVESSSWRRHPTCELPLLDGFLSTTLSLLQLASGRIACECYSVGFIEIYGIPNSTTLPCVNLATACDSSVLDTLLPQCQMNFVNGFLLCGRDLHQMTLIDEHLLVSGSLDMGMKGCHRANLGLKDEAETSSNCICKVSVVNLPPALHLQHLQVAA